MAVRGGHWSKGKFVAAGGGRGGGGVARIPVTAEALGLRQELIDAIEANRTTSGRYNLAGSAAATQRISETQARLRNIGDDWGRSVGPTANPARLRQDIREPLNERRAAREEAFSRGRR